MLDQVHVLILVLHREVNRSHRVAKVWETAFPVRIVTWGLQYNFR